MDNIFDRSKHVFQSDSFEELIKDIIRFFNGTPVHRLPPPVSFTGTGVYALYYIGKSPYYRKLYQQNRLDFSQPIYIGKAVPRGWRQGRMTHNNGRELYGRLSEHAHSLIQATNLDVTDFYCRFIILEDTARNLIGTVEAALIRHYTPIWNNSIDGFGNHDPGKGRYNQAKSDWDILHPGRIWADRCCGESATLNETEQKIQDFFRQEKQ